MNTDPIADIRARLNPLLAEVEAALERRDQQYPALVEAGRMDAKAAADEIRIWRAIAADWRNIVAATGDRGRTVSIADKVKALVDSIGRYDAALARAIANEKHEVRRDCAEISDRRYLADRHGQAVARFIELSDSRDRLIDIAVIYHSELPGAPAWRGAWSGIDHYFEFHRAARAEKPIRKAA